MIVEVSGMFESYNNNMTLQFSIINVLPVATVEGLNEADNIPFIISVVIAIFVVTSTCNLTL